MLSKFEIFQQMKIGSLAAIKRIFGLLCLSWQAVEENGATISKCPLLVRCCKIRGHKRLPEKRPRHSFASIKCLPFEQLTDHIRRFVVKAAPDQSRSMHIALASKVQPTQFLTKYVYVSIFAAFSKYDLHCFILARL